MIVRYFLVFASDDLSKIKRTSQDLRSGGDIVPGIEVKDAGFHSALYEELQSIDFPYVIILDLTDHKPEDDFNETASRLAGPLFQVLLTPSYWKNFNDQVLFIKTGGPAMDKTAILEKCLGEYGLHHIRIITLPGDPTVTYVHQPIEKYQMPPADEYVNTKGDRWVLFGTDAVHISADYESLSKKIEKYRDSDIHVRRHDQSGDLLKANLELKEKVAILTKNIYDLNNYYRYVRGETMFKHHNRNPDVIPTISAFNGDDKTNAGLISADLSEKGKYVAYYNTVYENMPGIYKRIATIVKIFFGRRELLYYISKKHKKAFLDFVHCMSEEKQVQIWYYYEYEILPGWYKKIGKIFRDKRK